MKKKMFALAFGLLLTFGLQGQFAQIDPVTEIGDSHACRVTRVSCGVGRGVKDHCVRGGQGVVCNCGDVSACY